MSGILDHMFYSFPVQLVLVHVRKNLGLVLVWVFMIALVSGNVGKIYGVHYLFLDPEYLNRVNFWSFLLVGLAFGNLVVAYNITCYILVGHRFPFIGILEKPFAKFSINNSLLPILTLLVYVGFIVRFQIRSEHLSTISLILDVLGFLIGLLVMLLFMFLYFRWTNQDIFKFLSGSVDKRLRKSSINRSRVMSRLKETRQLKYPVTNYVDLKLRNRSCVNLQDFYDKQAIVKVFDQNHLNSVVIEIIIILVLLLLGSFMENPYLQIPAAASCILMMAILVMLIGAVSYWFKGWGTLFILGAFLLVNFFIRIGLLKGVYHAKGLNYDVDKVEYSIEHLSQLSSRSNFEGDSIRMLGVLEAWKSKQKDSIPKMIFQCVSGGGQRAALWTLNSLIEADSVLGGELQDRTFMITGASGGMIGASYFREVQHQPKEQRPAGKALLENMGKDNLNPIIFSLLVNDAFFRVRSFDYEGRKYVKDRGYVFENNLNRNLNGIFTRRLSDYRDLEELAKVPMVLMSPVIANDGRKLYISTLPTSFLNYSSSQVDHETNKIKGVGFSALFKDQASGDLSFLTALRMSASFPYITPTISLPSAPTIEIMDAGIADNFGISDALNFIGVFKDWFDENTSGIILLIARDTRKNSPIEPQTNPTLVDRLTQPIASVYNNLANIQDLNNDDRIESMSRLLDVPLYQVMLEYDTYTNITEDYFLKVKAVERRRLERASLSWHLTSREKENIIYNIRLPNNQEALRHLGELFEVQSNHQTGSP